MDPVHIEKTDENAQGKVDDCLHRLRQMMLDSDNEFTFDMQGTGTGTVVTSIVVAPKNPPKPQSDFKPEAVANGPDAPAAAEEPPPAKVLAVAEEAPATDAGPAADPAAEPSAPAEVEATPSPGKKAEPPDAENVAAAPVPAEAE